MSNEFWEAYKDPRWQRRKAEILDRDGYECTTCGDTKTTLHVHHKVYRAGAKPWDYEDDVLITLCDPCHKALTESVRSFREIVAALDGDSLERLIGYAKGLLIAQNAGPDNDMATEVFSHAEAVGIADAYSPGWERAEALIGALKGKTIDHPTLVSLFGAKK